VERIWVHLTFWRSCCSIINFLCCILLTIVCLFVPLPLVIVLPVLLRFTASHHHKSSNHYVFLPFRLYDKRDAEILLKVVLNTKNQINHWFNTATLWIVWIKTATSSIAYKLWNRNSTRGSIVLPVLLRFTASHHHKSSNHYVFLPFRLYDKRDDFNFAITNFPPLDSTTCTQPLPRVEFLINNLINIKWNWKTNKYMTTKKDYGKKWNLGSRHQ
jgi:hypothetical protein